MINWKNIIKSLNKNMIKLLKKELIKDTLKLKKRWLIANKRSNI